MLRLLTMSRAVREADKVYYVDFTGGNDANSGIHPTLPWKTLAKVNATTLYPGNHVLFKRGETWAGIILNLTCSGTSVYPIHYGSYGIGNKPILEARLTYADFALHGGTVYTRGQNWNRIPSIRGGCQIDMLRK